MAGVREPPPSAVDLRIVTRISDGVFLGYNSSVFTCEESPPERIKALVHLLNHFDRFIAWENGNLPEHIEEFFDPLILGFIFWIGWHIIQTRQESAELVSDVAADRSGDETRESIDRYY